jgi:hypothetical protein
MVNIDDILPVKQDVIDDIEKQRQRLIDVYAKGTITADELKKRLLELDKKRKLIENITVQKQKQPEGMKIERAIQLIVKGAMAFTRIQSRDEKNRVIKKLFSKITLKDDKIVGFQLMPQFDVSVGQSGSPTDRDSSPLPA